MKEFLDFLSTITPIKKAIKPSTLFVAVRFTMLR